MIYLLIENTKSGVNVLSFKSESKRAKHLKALLKEYENEYKKPVSSPDDLNALTFGEVWIDLFETVPQ